MTHGKHGATLRNVVLAMALALLGQRAHAHAHPNAHANSPLSAEDARGGADAPLPAPPLGYTPDSGGGACGGECTLRAWRAMVDLLELCRERGWVLAPSDGDQFVVTTGTSATAVDQSEEERDRQGGSRSIPLPPPHRPAAPPYSCQNPTMSAHLQLTTTSPVLVSLAPAPNIIVSPPSN